MALNIIMLSMSFALVYFVIYTIQKQNRKKKYVETTCKILGLLDMTIYGYYKGEKRVKGYATLADIELTLDNGEIYKLRSQNAVPSNYAIGQVVPFYYDPQDINDNDFTLKPPLIDTNRFTLALILGAILPGFYLF